MTQMVTETDLATQFGYNALTDRCDNGSGKAATMMADAPSCGAKAKVFVPIGKHFLLFCRHHYNRHEPALAAQGLEGIEFDAN